MSKNAVIKKATRQLVYNKIEGALSEMKNGVKEKKFSKKLKQASKILAKDITKVIEKAISKKADSQKKSSKKKENGKTKKADKIKKGNKASMVKLPQVKPGFNNTAEQIPVTDNATL